jgi:hypothetical protein
LAPRPGERVLAAGQAESGEWLVATTARLGIWAEGGDGIVREWTEISTAGLKGDDATLTIEWCGPREPAVVRLGRRQRRIASVVNERVTASVVAARAIPVTGGTIRIAIRRADDGGLAPQVVAPVGIDLADPLLARSVEEAVRDLAEATGLDPAAVRFGGDGRLV